MVFNMNDIIFKKREGGKLSKEEIDYWITGYVAGDIPDYQVSALLMAIFFKGLDREETFSLTTAMRYSGDTIDLSPIKGIKVDKHSTGGVGDKTTLIVAPLASACIGSDVYHKVCQSYRVFKIFHESTVAALDVQNYGIASCSQLFAHYA